MPIGSTVKRSEYAIMPKRDYWNRCGREPMKSGAKRELDRAIADRGIVIEAPHKTEHGAMAMKVQMPSGSVESSLAHLWEPA